MQVDVREDITFVQMWARKEMELSGLDKIITMILIEK